MIGSVSDNLSILSWNIQGSLRFPRTNLTRIAPTLRATPARIICLQESQTLRQGVPAVPHLNSFHRAIPQSHQNGNSIHSVFPITTFAEIDFPQSITPKKTLERALWADIQLEIGLLRVYNCHLGIRGVGPNDRAQQLRYILSHADGHDGPTIICGDMNTTIPAVGLQRRIIQLWHQQPTKNLLIDGEVILEDERHSFAELAKGAGFTDAIDIKRSTWSLLPPFGWEAFGLKLDWFFVRNLPLPTITLGEYISDHRSVLATW